MLAIERPDVALSGFAGVAENEFEVRIDGDRRGGIRFDRADVHAFVHSFEQPGERCAAGIHDPRL